MIFPPHQEILLNLIFRQLYLRLCAEILYLIIISHYNSGTWPQFIYSRGCEMGVLFKKAGIMAPITVPREAMRKSIHLSTLLSKAFIPSGIPSWTQPRA